MSTIDIVIIVIIIKLLNNVIYCKSYLYSYWLQILNQTLRRVG